jgi:hypothetical protein
MIPTMKLLNCSKTTLTGESKFHISIPQGIEPGSLMTGSNRWTTEPVYEHSEIAGFPQGAPSAANNVGCEAGRRTCSWKENLKLAWNRNRKAV